jgi:hypothetical protein|uniref:Uncharacterized protein n=1 Tax=Picea glauca TaxID=3330 RepID=A0A101LVC5_PICGL|nr:hypothetical protein ABT39_MTgene2134 [Picea glauca]QHR86897.1 hypothetical protein Q903MT_gene904 [Picea sitchensis]
MDQVNQPDQLLHMDLVELPVLIMALLQLLGKLDKQPE